MVGTWKIPEMEPVKLPEMAAAAFADVIRGLIGATYIPVLYCGEQFVNGTNYMIICKQIIAAKGNPEHIISMMINSSAQGNRIIQLEEII